MKEAEMMNRDNLLCVITDLKNLAASLQSLAEEMPDNEQKNEVHNATTETKTDTVPTEKKITLEQVRTVLAEKSHDGFTTEVRTLLLKYGGKKLSEIDPVNYAALLADAEELK
jgi:hypothetical protein